MSGGVLYALGLTLFAGLATGIGSLIAFFYKKSDRKFLAFALGLSAGVMIYISFMELLFEARLGIEELTGSPKTGLLYTVLAFFSGIGFAAVVDALVPHSENPHHPEMDGDTGPCAGTASDSGAGPGTVSSTGGGGHKGLERVGVATAIAIAAHNFPEGMATFLSALDSIETGIAIAVAVAIHNIPVGIAISAPIYAATGRRRRAFFVALLAGLAELAGALVAWALLVPLLSPMVMELVSAVVAGVMVFISLDGLLPAARQYGKGHLALYGLIAGMVVIAASMSILE